MNLGVSNGTQSQSQASSHTDMVASSVYGATVPSPSRPVGGLCSATAARPDLSEHIRQPPLVEEKQLAS